MRVLHFRAEGKLTFLQGDAARNNIYIITSASNHFPDLWKKNPETVDSYAKFYQRYLKRGFYEVEGEYINIKVDQSTPSLPGMFTPDFLLFPKEFARDWQESSFERYNFVSF